MQNKVDYSQLLAKIGLDELRAASELSKASRISDSLLSIRRNLLY